MCNSAVLAIFASGRTRGLALEVGGGVAHAVPVFEGFALNHAVLRLEGAGQDVTHQLKLMLEERGHHHLSVRGTICWCRASNAKRQQALVIHKYQSGIYLDEFRPVRYVFRRVSFHRLGCSNYHSTADR